MLYVTQTAESLSDQMIQILDRCEDLQDFHTPAYRLGPDEPLPETPLTWQTTVPIRYSTDDSLVDQEYIWQGKNSPLSPHLLRSPQRGRQDQGRLNRAIL